MDQIQVGDFKSTSVVELNFVGCYNQVYVLIKCIKIQEFEVVSYYRGGD